MSSDVLSTDDLLGAAWVYRRTADELHDVVSGLDALLLHAPLDPDNTSLAPRSLAAVGAACRDSEARLRLLATLSDSSDAILGANFLRAAGHVVGLTVRGLSAFDMTRLFAEGLKGTASVHDEGIDPAPSAQTPPRSVTDLVAAEALRDDAKHGAMDVQFVHRRDGSRAVIVHITGLKALKNPWGGHDVATWSTCARAIEGRPTAYEDGVIKAMKAAGVTERDDVMMVGHSLGGMIAVNATKTLRHDGYHVTHVLTLGAPVGWTVGGLPDSVRVLSLEDRSDPVPRADLRPNPKASNIRTVAFDAPGRHDSRRVYLRGTAGLDARHNADLRAFADSARGFLDGASVETHRYTVTRTVF